MEPKGISIIGSGSGCGKTWHAVALLSMLRAQGHFCVPFKPVAVMDPADLSSPDRRPAVRAVYHHLVAAGVPYAPYYSPLIVVPAGAGKGMLSGNGMPSVEVALAGPDQVDYSDMPGGLYEMCVGIVAESFRECARNSDYVVLEGAGDAALAADRPDVANEVATQIAGLPVCAVYRPDRTAYPSIDGFIRRLPEGLRRRVVAGIVNSGPVQSDESPASELVDAVRFGKYESSKTVKAAVELREHFDSMGSQAAERIPWSRWLSMSAVPAGR